mmetsp:Transcript_118415/g.334734  ORF Transcript_118415/g.334734 Transcript_118415/m.334734 type:complete len:208 (-) Transcript_118415:1288-1911(-)
MGVVGSDACGPDVPSPARRGMAGDASCRVDSALRSEIARGVLAEALSASALGVRKLLRTPEYWARVDSRSCLPVHGGGEVPPRRAPRDVVRAKEPPSTASGEHVTLVILASLVPGVRPETMAACGVADDGLLVPCPTALALDWFCATTGWPPPWTYGEESLSLLGSLPKDDPLEATGDCTTVGGPGQAMCCTPSRVVLPQGVRFGEP